MVSFTLLSAITACVASTVSANTLAGGYPYFRLKVHVDDGFAKPNGSFIAPYHTGAGENFLVTTRNHSTTAQFQQTGDGSAFTIPFQTNIGYSFFYVNLTNFGPQSVSSNGTFSPAAPAGYYTVVADVESTPTTGFEFLYAPSPLGTGVLGYNTTQGPVTDFATFAVCHVKHTLFGSPRNQLLWKSTAAVADPKFKCADVTLEYISEE